MEEFNDIVRLLKKVVESKLSGWPAEWTGFNWPGYTYEHTLRVRNLSVSMARRLSADQRIVELAALLHDIGKPEGEPHADVGAQRAETILSDLGIDAYGRSRVCHIIRTHLAKEPGYPVENLVLYDADFIDANYGYVGFARYITIRASRGETFDEMVANAGSWLSQSKVKYKRLFTDVGHVIACERLEQMQSFLQSLRENLENKNGPAIDIAHYLAADACRPNLFRQMEQMENVLRCNCAVKSLQPSVFLCEFVQALKEEITGER